MKCAECEDVCEDTTADTTCEVCEKPMCWTCAPGDVCRTCRKAEKDKRESEWLDHCEQVGDEYRNGER